jgi:diadenosine tetraphosphatase ApaH/serine/threonine PP2A family protein phosphatase
MNTCFPRTRSTRPSRCSRSSEKAIINPGSVGQPRDLDPRASYAIIEDDCVRFFRLEYDIDAVVSKIRSIPELLDWLGERLYEGR